MWLIIALAIWLVVAGLLQIVVFPSLSDNPALEDGCMAMAWPAMVLYYLVLGVV